MSWWMGAGLGFLRGGPLGALVGGAAQYFLTKKLRARVQKSLPGIQNEGVFATCVIVVMTKVAMAHGNLTSNEVETIYKFFVNRRSAGNFTCRKTGKERGLATGCQEIPNNSC